MNIEHNENEIQFYKNVIEKLYDFKERTIIVVDHLLKITGTENSKLFVNLIARIAESLRKNYVVRFIII